MKSTKRCLSAFAIALVLIMPGIRAIAQEGPCKADMEKFCKDAKGKERMTCMKAHQADFSDACKAKMAAHKGRGMENNPCAADMEKFCKDSKGKDRMDCMKAHEKDLSGACKTKMAAWKGRDMKDNPCAADMEKFCKDAKGKDRMDCMKTHEADLSDACKAKIAERKSGKNGHQHFHGGGHKTEPAATTK